MKKLILLTCLLFSIAACDATDPLYDPFTPNLEGTWQLTEVLADPGDGSGTYQPVESDKTIAFFADGTFEASEDMCTRGRNEDLKSIGTYSLNDSSLTVTNCDFGVNQDEWKLKFSLDAGCLYLSIPCIEPCGEKYERITGK